MNKMIKIIVLLVILTATFSFSQEEISSQDSLEKDTLYLFQEKENSQDNLKVSSLKISSSRPTQTEKKQATNNDSYNNCPNGSYKNSKGNIVCRPSANNVGGATAICRDGTYSYSQSRQGTCSRHGGVARWL